MLSSHNSSNLAANITALNNVTLFKAQADDETIENACNVLKTKVLVERCTRREGVSGKRWHDDMIRQGERRVAIAQKSKDRQELNETA